MSSLKEVLSPARQNLIQRRGFFGTLALALLVLLLHFPFGGYEVERYVTTQFGYGPCPNPSLEDIMKMTSEQSAQNLEATKRCTDSGEMQTLPFPEWRSKTPIIEWFGSLVHTIAALAFTLSIGGIWFWIFRTHDGD